MTILSKIIRIFPIIHFFGFGTLLFLGLTNNPWFIAWALFWLYLLPLILNYIHNLFFPLKEEDIDLSEKKYSAWWGSHQLQFLFIAIPQFEQVLHIVPGLFSLWLRSWGSKIGKDIYWTPRVEILDRGLIEIGDYVVLGHLAAMSSHMVASIDGKPYLIIKKIRVGEKSFIGFDSQLGPGTTIEPRSKLKPKTRMWWRGDYQ